MVSKHHLKKHFYTNVFPVTLAGKIWITLFQHITSFINLPNLVITIYDCKKKKNLYTEEGGIHSCPDSL